jgi:hypothetical protein
MPQGVVGLLKQRRKAKHQLARQPETPNLVAPKSKLAEETTV